MAGVFAAAGAVAGAASLPPTLANLDGDSVMFSESGAAVLLDAGGDATVTDVDSPDFNGGNVTVSVATNRVDAEDILFIQNQGSGPGQIGVSGTDVNFGGVPMGTLAGGTGGAGLVVTLNGSATPAAVQALVRAIAYTNSNGANPSLAGRTVAVAVDDGAGGVTTARIAVSVAGVNDAPTLTLPASFATFAGDLLGFTGLSVADVDAGGGVLSLTLAAAAGSWVAASGAGVMVTGAGTGTLGLSGTVADLNAFLAATNVVFATPAGAVADIGLTATLNDGGNTGVDPGLTGDGSSEEASGSAAFIVAPVVASVAVPAAGFYFAGQDLLFQVTLSEPVFVDTNGGVPRLLLDIGGTNVSATYLSGDGTATLNFRYTITASDRDLDGIGLGANIDLNGGLIVDGMSNSVATLLWNVLGTEGVLVAGTSPVALDDMFAGAEDTVLLGASVLANDRDAEGDPLTALLVTGPTNGSVVLNPDGTFQYSPGTNFHGVDAFVYKANDGTSDSLPAVVMLMVAPVNDAPITAEVIPDQAATYGAPFSFTFSAGVFVDPDGDPLAYAADNIPPGINFDGPTRTFSGTMLGSGLWRVVLWATDDQVPPLSVTNTFVIQVGKTPLVAQADDQTKAYGAPNPPLTIHYTGFIGTNTAADLLSAPTATTVASNTSPPGTYPITVSGGNDARYSFVYSNGTLTIGKAVLRAVAESKSRAPDEPNPPLTICYSGFVGRDTEADLDMPPTASTTATTNSPPGSYPITLSGGSDNFYDLVLVDGILVIREPGVPRTSGTFQGLFAETGQARNESSGAISLTTREGKAFSAVLRIQGRRFPFSGTFDTIGRATNAILRPGNFPLLVELQIGVCDVLDRIGGRVTDFVWSSPIEADPKVSSPTTNEAGHYGFVLTGAATAAGPGPYGHSFGTLDVSKSGGLKLSLRCADRINVAAAMDMVVGGRAPCYAPLLEGQGAILGWLVFSNQPTTDVTGSFGWMRPPAPKRVVPQGFEATRFVYATRFRPPPRGQRIIDLSEGKLQFEGGQLAAFVQIPTQLTADHSFWSDGRKLPVRIRPKSGRFSGYVGSPQVAFFQGMFLQKTNVGVGFFEGVYSGLESGRVEFIP